MLSLTLVPIYLADGRQLVRGLATGLARGLEAEVRIRAPWFDPEVTFDPARGQYSSTRLLALLRHPPVPDLEAPDRILGVTTVDLFVPVLTYVFGEAQLAGPAAVVSTHRLRNEIYGLPADHELLARRLEIEAIHELGHTFGLVHCLAPECVMRSSTYVEEIDLKRPEFCDECLVRMRRASEMAGTGAGERAGVDGDPGLADPWIRANPELTRRR